MECERHPERGAVAQCAECGAGVCKECAEKTAFTKGDYGTLCVDCLCAKANKAVEIYKKDNKSRLIRIIVSSICYAIGLFLIIAAFVGSGGIDVVALICGIAMCGFYTGITWHKAAVQAHRQKEMEEGIQYVIDENGNIERKDGFWMKIIMCLVGTVIGVVFTPIRIIIDSVQIKRGKQSIAELSSMIADAQAI